MTAASTWVPPAQLRVDGTNYRVRLNDQGLLEVFIMSVWRSQHLFTAYDDASAQMVAEILVHRYVNARRANKDAPLIARRKPPAEG